MHILHIFTQVMRKFLIGILCVTFAFCLNGIKGDVALMSCTEVLSVTEQNVSYVARNDVHPDKTECNETIKYNYFLSNVFTNPIICDILVSTYSLSRVVSFPKNLKFTSTIQSLSTLKKSLSTGNLRSLNFDSCFTKSSNRYFVYALRRLLI